MGATHIKKIKHSMLCVTGVYVVVVVVVAFSLLARIFGETLMIRSSPLFI